MAAAYRSVPQRSTGDATTTIDVIQRVAGSFGTALLAVVLQHTIRQTLPGVEGGLGAFAGASGRNAGVDSGLAGAFAASFQVALGLLVLALPAALLLPGCRPEDEKAA